MVALRNGTTTTKNLSCKIKEIRMRDISNSVFLVFKTLVSISLIFFSFLVDLEVVFVLNKGDVKLFASIHGSN